MFPHDVRSIVSVTVFQLSPPPILTALGNDEGCVSFAIKHACERMRPFLHDSGLQRSFLTQRVLMEHVPIHNTLAHAGM